jgi:hypothetical protein
MLVLFLEGSSCPRNSNGPVRNTPNLNQTEELADKTIIVKFNNGASCKKRADYTNNINTQGAVAIKNIFDASGNFQSKWENAKQYSPKFEELEAVFFDICYEYGEERLTLERYREQWEIYNQLRAKLLGEHSRLPSQGEFTEDPSTPAAKTLKEYYVALDDPDRSVGHCHAWELLSKGKKQIFGSQYGWQDCVSFSAEGFRTTDHHEHVLLFEGPTKGKRVSVDEVLIVVDSYPKNTARKELSEKTAAMVLEKAALEQITQAVLSDLTAQYEFDLTPDLKARLETYIGTSKLADLLSPGYLEQIALTKDGRLKSEVWPFKQKKTHPGFQKGLRESVKQVRVNQREIVMEGGQWRVGDAKELMVGIYDESR